jgi:hypothetical protein
MTMKPAATLAIFGVLSLTATLRAQDSLLGHHRIDLKLKAVPAAELLSVLSLRSKAVAQHAGPSSDEGRPWEVEGSDQLEGIMVAVDFVATPVPQVVAETLGCLGFAYQESGNRIVIEKSADVLPADRCRSVARVAVTTVASGHIEPVSKKTYSWQLASISALEFIRVFSREAGKNIFVSNAQAGLLQDIMLRVDVSGMTDTEALHNLLGCIGWKLEKTSKGILALQADDAPPATECRGFTVLP